MAEDGTRCVLLLPLDVDGDPDRADLLRPVLTPRIGLRPLAARRQGDRALSDPARDTRHDRHAATGNRRATSHSKAEGNPSRRASILM